MLTQKVNWHCVSFNVLNWTTITRIYTRARFQFSTQKQNNGLSKCNLVREFSLILLHKSTLLL